MHIGLYIRSLREEKYLTVSDVSDHTGLSQPHILKIENNVYGGNLQTLMTLATYFDFEVWDFIKNGCNFVPDNKIKKRKYKKRNGRKQVNHDKKGD